MTNHAKFLRNLHQYGFGGATENVARIVPTQSIPASDYIGYNIKSLICDFRGLTRIDPGPHVVPSVCELSALQDAVRSSQIAPFADDAKIFREITSTCDVEQLQEHLFDSASLNFNFSKCKAQRITRKLKPVIFVYIMDGSQLEAVSAEKDLGVYITDYLTWNKQVNE